MPPGRDEKTSATRLRSNRTEPITPNSFPMLRKAAKNSDREHPVLQEQAHSGTTLVLRGLLDEAQRSTIPMRVLSRSTCQPRACHACRDAHCSDSPQE